MRILSLREIQQEELYLLEIFDAVCQRHHFMYRIIGGTLLGAIRHQGFIPWDDDIDVCMPRKDYEMFMRLDLSKELPPHIMRTNLTDKDYPYSHVKLLNHKIKVELLYDNQNPYRFLWIDIFPVDGLPQSNFQTWLLYAAVDTLKRIQGLCYAKPGVGKTPFRCMMKPVLRKIARLIGSKRCVAWIERLCKQNLFEQAEYVDIVNGGVWTKSRKMKRADFLSEEYVKYEGKDFPVPHGWRNYLKCQYGNYMELPDIAKRNRHIIKAWKEEREEYLE